MASSANPLLHDAHGEALSLNLDSSIYGTLAEIGAGQEVARSFLAVGGRRARSLRRFPHPTRRSAARRLNRSSHFTR